MLYAHTPREGDTEWHGLAEHLGEVARVAAENAGAFGGGELARWAGRWHDIGKANPAFQDYLRRCHQAPDRRHQTLDHKGAGVRAAREAACSELAFLLQGHHGGLPNKDDLGTRIKGLAEDATVNAGYAAAISAGLLGDGPAAGELAFPSFVLDARGSFIRPKLAFFLRMLFSALVDADHRDTERHFAPEQAANRGGTSDLASLLEQLKSDQGVFVPPSPDEPEHVQTVARVRNEVYQACLQQASRPRGFFRLTVPTGGGKTRSALAFALEHALGHGLERVIVAVPYLTITEQTADVYRGIFGDGRAVLEHHSGAGTRSRRDAEGRRAEVEGGEAPDELWRRLATQDWDAPIIVTTTVQLFESLFGHKPASCRKLHRIARSVVVLDEAQTLPTTLLEPTLAALRHLVDDYGTSVVFCTATQPAFDDAPGFRGLPEIREIAADPPALFRALRRVTYEWPALTEPWTWQRVAAEMRAGHQALAVLNTKADALALLTALGDDPDVVHLSTLLCGAHRRDVLAVVRRRLREGRRCLVVSTQVVEAGVDLDFPLVLRAIGPLDRIAQAAGRANREGRLAFGRVIVFDPADARPLPRGAYRTGSDVTKALLAGGALDLDHPETFVSYFRQFYRDVASLDRENIAALENDLQFQDVAEKFALIEDETASVVVRYRNLRHDLRQELPDGERAFDHGRETEELLRDLWAAQQGRRLGNARALFARAQPYLVARRRRELEADERAGNAAELVGGLSEWKGGYDEIRGLKLDRDPEEFIA